MDFYVFTFYTAQMVRAESAKSKDVNVISDHRKLII